MKKVLTTICAADIFGQKQSVTKQSVTVYQCSGVVILGTQAVYNIYVYIIMYVMNSLGTEDGVW